MPRILIDSLDDPRLDPYRHLKATNLTRWSNEFTAEGLLVVERLLTSRFDVLSVLASDRREAEISPHVPAGVPFYILPHRLAEELVGFDFHTGVLARGRQTDWPGIPDVVRAAGEQLTLAVCPDVNSPDNLGTIIRTCTALGVDALLLGQGCADPLSRRVSRTSMGATYKLPIIATHDIAQDLRRLRDEYDVELVATTLAPAAEPLRSARRAKRTAILFGNEKHGLEPELLSLCDRQVIIPMQPGTDSLNVAVAAGIVLHHFLHAKVQV